MGTSGEAFLRDFHALRPAVTSEVMAAGRDADGRSSYELVRDEVAGAERVLDLGCGDGHLLDLLAATGRDPKHLAGVDLSTASLAAAARRPALAHAALTAARCQQLPFPDRSFDACVSHLALMLMDDPEQVVAEVSRVLAPGGRLVCAVGGGPAGGEAWEVFHRLLDRALGPDRRLPPLGDRRTRDPEGLAAVLRSAGLHPADSRQVRIDLSGPVEKVWTALAGTYDTALLSADELAVLQADFHLALPLDPAASVTCAFRVDITTARSAA
ncbi:class I SAM-dependent methyltransferase [Streptomyces alkaliterrae]|uniref:Class I SAM-dependent methyltransferase n=2 Tax=Streptomyces alkaliterrae TaxID=2213162 RepID=A0A7W3ZSG8_9ACTN|nr:class I SAM-dependent methyltransferase [Streptomyces alkaliterrae]MBB1258687.1 class I SAM-dependent methyltransferase [Streptomyces alkaliterrae]